MATYSKAQKRAAKRARQDMDIAETPKKMKRGRQRMAEIADAHKGADHGALEARARKAGIDLANPKGKTDKASRTEAMERRAEQLRDLRAPWHGCNAGRAMASAVTGDRDKSELWTAICHIRKVQAAYDRAIGAPTRHAQCLRLLLPLEAMEADASSPPVDLRSDEEKQRQAVSAWMKVQGWLDHAKADAGECKRVVIDDERCRDPDALVRALQCVVDGIKGRKIMCRGA